MSDTPAPKAPAPSKATAAPAPAEPAVLTAAEAQKISAPGLDPQRVVNEVARRVALAVGNRQTSVRAYDHSVLGVAFAGEPAGMVGQDADPNLPDDVRAEAAAKLRALGYDVTDGGEGEPLRYLDVSWQGKKPA